MPLDKRRWTTLQQQQWLAAKFPAYREAQSKNKYDRFWPTFFEEWFNEYPASEPRVDEPTDSEHESDSDSEQTDGECRPASSKRKRRRTKKNVSVSRIDFNLVSIP
jgi:hypothetical protein